MRQRQFFFTLALLWSLILWTPAHAMIGEFYLGGSIGQATLENDYSIKDFKEHDTAYRAFVGHRLGLFPVLDFAVELGYRDLGDPSTTVAGQSIDLSVTGFDLSGLVIFPLGPIDLYLKGGGLGYKLDGSVADMDVDYDGTSFLYGAGIGARFWKLGVRAEYELMDVEELDRSSTYWLSVYYRF